MDTKKFSFRFDLETFERFSRQAGHKGLTNSAV